MAKSREQVYEFDQEFNPFEGMTRLIPTSGGFRSRLFTLEHFRKSYIFLDIKEIFEVKSSFLIVPAVYERTYDDLIVISADGPLAVVNSLLGYPRKRDQDISISRRIACAIHAGDRSLVARNSNDSDPDEGPVFTNFRLAEQPGMKPKDITTIASLPLLQVPRYSFSLK